MVRTCTHGVGERRVADFATEADRVAHPSNKRGARRAGGAVAFDRVAFDGVELAIDVALDLNMDRRTVDWPTHRSPNSWRSSVRARCRRVFTLASEIPISAATSFVDNPSISRKTTIAR